MSSAFLCTWSIARPLWQSMVQNKHLLLKKMWVCKTPVEYPCQCTGLYYRLPKSASTYINIRVDSDLIFRRTLLGIMRKNMHDDLFIAQLWCHTMLKNCVGIRHGIHWNVVVVSTHSLDPCLWRSPIIPLFVHQPVYTSIWPATPAGSVHKSRGDSVVCMWVQLKRCVVCGCCRGGIVVMNVIWHRLCVSMIWGREICLFWVGQGCDRWIGGSLSSELLMCGGGVRGILLLLLLWLDSFIQGRGCYSTFGWVPSIASLITLLQLLLSNVIKKSE